MEDTQDPSQHRCMAAKKLDPLQEFEKIMKKNPILVSTGCTEKFCQAGRMIHTDEPRIGENRPVEVVKKEASAFLWQLWQNGVFTEEHYRQRLDEVLRALEVSTTNGTRELDKTATWEQSTEELLHGVRLAWKNSRKCIMRSHYQELELCDLRHIHTSIGMVTTIIDEVIKAFNHGQIRPTAFVFPQRSIDSTGPMFWNKQLLNFASYQLEDGTILGDPSNVQLTTDMIELGWQPPNPKGQWDLLPIVAMAENDVPALAYLPDELCRLIDIEHPEFPETFRQLDLKWYQFPALSRLGFDIGGVQYTAAPFLGWYMDAEIGVRDLADSFRYNKLPDVAKAIGFDIKSYQEKTEYTGIESMEDLPDYDQLLWLSRAQTELNYAVRWSFLKRGITCVGTLAASSDWCQFDDENTAKDGFRLNSDPYWLAPPQGSIIPLWHRGSAPNYQPKPMITRHRYDPVKSWHRQRNIRLSIPLCAIKQDGKWIVTNLDPPAGPRLTRAMSLRRHENLESVSPNRIHIAYCSNGKTAYKLAEKLHRRIRELPMSSRVGFSTLNALQLRGESLPDIILVITSTTGNGTFPANGAVFAHSIDVITDGEHIRLSDVKFSVFGVGDSGYPNFNAAATKVYQYLKGLGARPIATGLVKADVALEMFPLRSFDRWWNALKHSLTGAEEFRENKEDKYLEHAEMVREFKDAIFLSNISPIENEEGIKITTIANVECEEMGHLRFLPCNSSSQVGKAVSALRIENAQTLVPFSNPRLRTLSYADLFTYIVDLEGNFESLKWLSAIRYVEDSLIQSSTVLEILEYFSLLNYSNLSDALRLDICLSMPLLRARTFSVASSASYIGKRQVELLVKPHNRGRFSQIFLDTLNPGAQVKYLPIATTFKQGIITMGKPLIAITTGTGFAPIRSILQQRIRLAQNAEVNGRLPPFVQSPISLFAGFKVIDRHIFSSIIFAAAQYNLIDMLFLVPSNKEKRRVQDYLDENKDRLFPKLREGFIYVCGSAALIKGVRPVIEDIIGGDITQILGRRYIEEVF